MLMSSGTLYLKDLVLSPITVCNSIIKSGINTGGTTIWKSVGVGDSSIASGMSRVNDFASPFSLLSGYHSIESLSLVNVNIPLKDTVSDDNLIAFRIAESSAVHILILNTPHRFLN